MSTSVLKPNSPVQLERTLGMPAEGPKCVPINLDFTAFTTYTLDYSNLTQRGFLSMVQTLWVNNLANSATLDIFIPASQQTIKVPALTQGYFCCLCPTPIKMTFTSTGNVAGCQVTLMNFPTAAAS